MGAVVLVVATLVVGIPLALLPPASPGPSTAPTTPASAAPSVAPPSATPLAEATPSPSPSPRPDWAGLDLPPLPAIAELTADVADAAGPDPGTTFTLRTTDGSPATSLAAGVTVEPAVVLAVAEGSDPSRATLRPTTPLDRGRTYRFTLTGPDGTVEGGWAFRVAAPPRVVGTLPADGVSGVPVDTGIEIAFDQDGVADPTKWFSISPKAAGRFERHDRTWAFVPDALDPSTLYTVIVRPGVPLEGSSLALEESVRFRFETNGPETGRPVSIEPARAVVEVAPGERPAVGVTVTSSGEVRPPRSVEVTLYRIADVDAAAAVAAALADQPTWTSYPHDPVDVSGLPLVGRVDTRMVLDLGDGYAGALRFPAPLDRGWYLVDLPDDISAGGQVLLQVTPVAAYVAAARDRTAVWVNRIGRGPIDGATVRLADGPGLGRTGADGLLLAGTPEDTFPGPEAEDPWTAPHPVLVVEAAGVGAAVLPLGLDSTGPYGIEEWSPWVRAAPSPWTSTLATDRAGFRRTDSVAAWGVVRDRATGAPPASVRLELAPASADEGAWASSTTPAAVASADVTPSDRGVFTATLPFEDLPLGSYQLTLSVAGRTLATRWVEVTVVRKPAWRLGLSPDHTAVMAGDPVTLTATATFYDGTPVPGLPVRFEVAGVTDAGSDDGIAASTGADGRAVTRIAARKEGSVQVSAASPELGEVDAQYANIVVFPSSLFVSIASSGLVGGDVRVEGSVRGVDLAAVESAIAADESWSEKVGPAVPGVRVTVSVESSTWVPVRSGTEYDFVLKRTVPTYMYEQRDLPKVSGTATSAADGSFDLRIRLPTAARATGVSVQVTATATDARGRAASDDGWAYRPHADTGGRDVWLDPGPAGDPAFSSAWCGSPSEEYAYGETVRLTLRDEDGPLPTGGLRRFLFVTAREGIQDADVSSSPLLVRPFDRDAVPSIDLYGVAFDGTTYRATKWPTRAYVDPESRRIEVALSTDLAAGAVHRPGETASVTVRTREPAGGPVAADVVIRAIDQKLYDAGMAWDDDPAWSLYGAVDGGLAATYVSHQLPGRHESPGCGSTTGGGDGGGGDVRTDFRDRVVFVRVRTGPDGMATVSIPLPDDLTAWHVAADATTDDLRVGTATTSIPVGLPFFVEPVVPDTVLASDAPGIVLRAYGSALAAGDVVRYTVRAPTLLTAPATVDAPAFENDVAWLSPTGAPLPAGLHRIVVEATARTAAGELRDAKEVTLEVVPTRLTARRTVVAPVASGRGLPGAADGLTTCTLADAGRASLVPLLESIAAGEGPRADQRSAAAAAADLLVAEFGRAPADLPASSFDPRPFVYTAGVALLPYGSPDLDLTALAAIGAPDVFDAAVLEQYLGAVLTSAGTPRDRRIVALAGLAALGAPVAADLQAAAAADDLSDLERAWLAVGLAEVGDLTAAARMERGLLAETGERSGGWARLRTGTTAHHSITATALLAIAAARIGDPLAPDLEAYVTGERDPDAVHPLEEVAYATRAFERLPSAEARVAWTVDGTRHEEDLGSDPPVALVLTPAQRDAIVLEPLAGAVSAACAWDEPTPAAALPADASISVIRRVAPSGALPSGALVTIELTVTAGPLAPTGLYRTVETLPAGLAPTGRLVGPPVDDGEGDGNEAEEDHAIPPWSIVGNRAEWGFWLPAADGKPIVLRTVGRVVAPGTYAWEPAVVQSVTAPSIGATVPATSITVLAR